MRAERSARPTAKEAGLASVYRVCLVLAMLSGGAALGHQLLWTRRLVDLLGASAASTTRVFGCFFLGLALGAAWAVWLVGRTSRPWRLLAAVELGVALLSLPALLLPLWTGWIWPALGPERLTGWAGPLVKLLASVLVILPPAFLMGTVLPLMTKAALASQQTLGRQGVWLYAVNTFGGFLGLVLVAGITLQSLGAAGSMWLAMGINVTVAGAAWWLDRRSLDRSPSRSAAPKETTHPRPDWPSQIAAFSSGFLILAFEVLTLEMIMLVAPLSFYAPAAILLCVILLLAVAAAVVPVLSGLFKTDRQFIRMAAAAAAIATVLCPILFMAHAVKSGGVPPAPDFSGFLSRLLGLALVPLSPVLLLAGFIFPAAIRLTRRGAGPSKTLARLLAINGLGGLLGAECAYRLLMPLWGVHVSIGVVGIGYALLALGLAWKEAPGARPFLLPAAGLGAVLVVTATRLTGLPMVNPNMNLKIVDQSAGRDGTLAVVEHPSIGRGMLVANQYMLGSTSVRYDQERQAHIPLVLHPKPADVAFIGLATGITPGGALQHAAVERIKAIEISSQVVEAARKHFDEFNYGLMNSPRVEVILEDGRTYVASADEMFDVIAGDLFLPWGVGASRLYALEHFQAVKRALRPGGLFCQWLPMYQLTSEQFDTIVRTFQQVFPRIALFQNSLQPQTPALALIGFKGGELDWEVIRRRCAQEREQGRLLDPAVRQVEGVALLYLGTRDEAGSGPINTLDNMWVELDAGRERVTGDPNQKYFIGPRWIAFLQVALGKSAFQGLPPELASLPQAGLELTKASSRARPASPLADERTRRFIPATIQNDSQADWNRWPGTRAR